MSSNLAYSLASQPARLPSQSAAQDNPWLENPRQIEIVPSRAQKRARPKLAYALIAIGGLLGIFIAQLMLSIALSNGAYEISSLLIEKRNLGRVEGSLNEQLELAGSTQNLAANAQSLGMVSTTSPAFLRLSDGAVIGSAVAAPTAAAGTTLIANSLLNDTALVSNSAAVAETDTGTGAVVTEDTATGSATAETESSTTGAPATTGTEASVPSTTGVLPSPVTH